jgi:histidine ammonia-lyase
MGVEIMNAAQGLEFRKPLKSAPLISDFITEYRKEVPFIEIDVEMHPLMQKSIQFIKSYSTALSVNGVL